MDFDSIPYGVDFREHIRHMIGRAKVLLAVMGPDWVGRRRQRGRRIDDPTDFVRLEIAYALDRQLPIIPILISNTRMLRPDELPKDIESLAFRNALTLDIGIDFHHHAERLIVAINRLLIAPPGQTTTATAVEPVATTLPVPKPRPLGDVGGQISIPSTSLMHPEAGLAPTEAPVPAVAAPKTTGSRTPPPDPHKQQAVVDAGPKQPHATVRTEQSKLARGVAHFGHAVGETSWVLLRRLGKGLNRVARRVTSLGPTFIEVLRRHKKSILSSSLVLVGICIIAGATFEFVHNKAGWLNKSQPANNAGGAVSNGMVAPSPSAIAASTATRTGAPTVAPVSPSPSSPRGLITIDSIPQGQAFELIDSKSHHRSGLTPATFDDLPTGYAEVIFKRPGYIDHTQTVWLASNNHPSTTWNFPESSRIHEAAPAHVPSPAPATPQPDRPAIVQEASTHPAPPAPVTPAPSNDRPWQGWIVDFVRQFVAVNQSQNADATVACYAPAVNYFGETGKGRNQILHDIQKYNAQWPRRWDSIDGDIDLEEKMPGQQYRADFKLNFYAESPSPAQWSRGQVAMTLDLDIIDGSPKITGINQRRLQHQNGRGKGPRPPAMEAALQPINPRNLTRVVIKRYGFSALLPTDLFPDAEEKLADGETDSISSAKGCATASFRAAHDAIRGVYERCLADFRAGSKRPSVDYKVIKDTWFVVSGSSKTTGYYVKGVKHGDDVFVMELEYAGATCNIPGAMLAEISHAFDGN